MNETPSVTVSLTAPHPPLLNGDVLETVVEVTVSSPEHHAAYLLNAAAVAADAGLRAVSPTHPAHRSAQCGRTFVHLSHDTTEGRCYGLSKEAVTEHTEDLLTVASEDARLYRAGLEVIAANGCSVSGDDHDCFERGRVVSGTFPACFPCVAAKVLAGEPLPTEADRG